MNVKFILFIVLLPIIYSIILFKFNKRAPYDPIGNIFMFLINIFYFSIIETLYCLWMSSIHETNILTKEYNSYGEIRLFVLCSIIFVIAHCAYRIFRPSSNMCLGQYTVLPFLFIIFITVAVTTTENSLDAEIAYNDKTLREMPYELKSQDEWPLHSLSDGH